MKHRLAQLWSQEASRAKNRQEKCKDKNYITKCAMPATKKLVVTEIKIVQRIPTKQSVKPSALNSGRSIAVRGHQLQDVRIATNVLREVLYEDDD